jgi:magnesium-transporting ATPase (P-type)
VLIGGLGRDLRPARHGGDKAGWHARALPRPPHTGDDLDRARTIALTMMVIFQVVHVGNVRSEHRSLFAKSPFSNRILFAGTAIAVSLHIAAMHLGPTQAILHLQPLDLATWATILAVSLPGAVAVELHRLLRTPDRPHVR